MNSVASTLTPIDPLKPDPRARSERQAHTVPISRGFCFVSRVG